MGALVPARYVFRWNDRDDQFRRAIDMADARGIPIFFDFAHTWGRSRRLTAELRGRVDRLSTRV